MQLAKESSMQKILRLPEVQAVTGLSRSSIYGRAKSRTFPRPVKLGLRASGWVSEEVEAWRDARIADRDAREGRVEL
jgi:prophage regulatory protein